MPTIAQIIAAKKAKAAVKTQVSNDDRELDEALDRIDPPGKRKALVLSASTPLPAADVAQKAHHKELRSLSRSQGEAIPVVPVGADRETETWHEALNSFESSLCIMRDVNEPDVVWLAIRPEREGLPPLLVHRLPMLLWDHPNATYSSRPF
jgi:hypothetical protein